MSVHVLVADGCFDSFSFVYFFPIHHCCFLLSELDQSNAFSPYTILMSLYRAICHVLTVMNAVLPLHSDTHNVVGGRDKDQGSPMFMLFQICALWCFTINY